MFPVMMPKALFGIKLAYAHKCVIFVEGSNIFDEWSISH